MGPDDFLKLSLGAAVAAIDVRVKAPEQLCITLPYVGGRR